MKNNANVLGAAVAAMSLSAPLPAQPAPEWNRKVEALAILPGSGGQSQILAHLWLAGRSSRDFAGPASYSVFDVGGRPPGSLGRCLIARGFARLAPRNPWKTGLATR